MKNQRTIRHLCLAALFFVASSANAVIIQESWTSYDPVWGGDAEYTVNNNSSSDIYAFIIANDAATYAWSNNNGWESSIVDAFWWNDANSNINYLGGYDQPVYTTSLGLFNDLFSGYEQAIVYSFNYYNFNGLATNPDAQPIAVGSTVGGFNYTTQILASPFIAIDINGRIIDAGEALHVVPVPAAAWLFASGLLGLATLTRRRV